MRTGQLPMTLEFSSRTVTEANAKDLNRVIEITVIDAVNEIAIVICHKTANIQNTNVVT